MPLFHFFHFSAFLVARLLTKGKRTMLGVSLVVTAAHGLVIEEPLSDVVSARILTKQPPRGTASPTESLPGHLSTTQPLYSTFVWRTLRITRGGIYR